MLKLVILLCAVVFVSAVDDPAQSPLESVKLRPLKIINREISSTKNVFVEGKRKLNRFSQKHPSREIDSDIHYKRFGERLAEIGNMETAVDKCYEDIKELSLQMALNKLVWCLQKKRRRTETLAAELRRDVNSCINRVIANGIC